LALLALVALWGSPAWAGDEPTPAELTIEDLGRAAYRALRFQDVTPLERFLPTSEEVALLLASAHAEIEEASGKEAADAARALFERAGGHQGYLDRTRTSLRSLLEQAHASLEVPWSSSGFEGVNASGEHALAVAAGPADRVLFEVHFRAGGQRYGFVLPAYRSPRGWIVAPEGQIAIGGIRRIGVDGEEDMGLEKPAKGEAVTVEFEVDFEAAFVRGSLAPDVDRTAVTDRIVALMGERLRARHLDVAEVSAPAPGRLRVVAHGGADAVAAIEEAAEDRRLALRIEVLPTEELRRRLGDDPPGRSPRLESGHAPWQGVGDTFPPTEEGFEAFNRHEVARWQAAREAGAPFVPSDPRYALVPERAVADPAVEAFHLLEVPAQHETFDARMVEDPAVGQDDNDHMPVVLYSIRKEWQGAFGAWTERNLGMPMAIVVDDVWLSAPRINARLLSNVQTTLGLGSRAELEKEARQLVSALQSAPWPAPLRRVPPPPR
jgi:hypothetical protein